MTLNGRRVEGPNDLAQPGDYAPRFDGEAVASLWFILPEGSTDRIAATGHGSAEPEWDITIGPDGAVTVDPSINYPDRWHGHLREGVWSW